MAVVACLATHIDQLPAAHVLHELLVTNVATAQSQYHSQPVGLFREQSCHSSGAKPTCYGPKPARQAEAWQLGQAKGCPHQSSGCDSDGVAAALRRLRALLALK